MMMMMMMMMMMIDWNRERWTHRFCETNYYIRLWLEMYLSV
jgi:hypothetical protein